MSDNDIKFNLAEYLVGMEKRLSAEIKGVEANVNRLEANVQADIKDVQADIKGVEANVQAEIKGVEANVQADIKGVEADIKDVKADNNKRHDDHARETRDKIKELKVSIKWWIGIGLAVATIVLGVLEYNSSRNSGETTVNHVIKLR